MSVSKRNVSSFERNAAKYGGAVREDSSGRGEIAHRKRANGIKLIPLKMHKGGN